MKFVPNCFTIHVTGPVVAVSRRDETETFALETPVPIEDLVGKEVTIGEGAEGSAGRLAADTVEGFADTVAVAATAVAVADTRPAPRRPRRPASHGR